MLCDEYGAREIVTLTLSGAVFVFVTLLLIAFCTALHSDKEPVKRFFVITTLATGISCLLTILTVILQASFCKLWSENSEILVSFHQFFWFVCTAAVTVNFIGRLHHVFHETPYAYSRKVKLFLLSLAVFDVLITVAAAATYSSSKALAFSLGVVAVGLYLIISALTLALFMHGLFQVQADCRSIVSVMAMPEVIDESHMSPRQKLLIETMSKYVVLVSLILLTTLVTAVILAVRSQQRRRGYGSLHYLQVNWLVCDLFCNFLCLVTQFRFFGQKRYYQYCGPYHNCCKRMIQKLAITEMDQKRRDSIYARASLSSNQKPGGKEKTSKTSKTPKKIEEESTTATTPETRQSQSVQLQVPQERKNTADKKRESVPSKSSGGAGGLELRTEEILEMVAAQSPSVVGEDTPQTNQTTFVD